MKRIGGHGSHVKYWADNTSSRMRLPGFLWVENWNLCFPLIWILRSVKLLVEGSRKMCMCIRPGIESMLACYVQVVPKMAGVYL